MSSFTVLFRSDQHSKKFMRLGMLLTQACKDAEGQEQIPETNLVLCSSQNN